MTLRSKMRRIVGLDEIHAEVPSTNLPATHQRSTNVVESTPRRMDLGLALHLVERASAEIASVRAQAQAQRNVNSVLAAARQQIAAAGALVTELREQLRETEEKAERLAHELEHAERGAARGARAEAELAHLQLAISHGLSDGLLGTRSPDGPKPISVRSSNRAHLASDGFGWERGQ
jgi:DNA repair exonuclease SbcCD ATPase subunit